MFTTATARQGATALALAGLLTLGGTTGALADTAPAAVSVANDQGQAQALVAGGTTLDVSGTGFQSVVGGQGGIYVAFGWVSDGDWAPSTGGKNGADYRFAPDKEDADNAGYLKFVSFPGGATAAAANGGVLAEDGTWATELAVPSATFTGTDRDGKEFTVNCQEVQCGVITMGAHNITNANNETFTPVEFVDQYGPTQTTDAQVPPVKEPSQINSQDPNVEVDQTPEPDSTETGPEQPAGNDQAKPNPRDNSRGLIFGAIGAVVVVGLVVVRRVLARRLHG